LELALDDEPVVFTAGIVLFLMPLSAGTCFTLNWLLVCCAKPLIEMPTTATATANENLIF
jgi:hypothetical protein